jgi:hypothetical protein
VETDTSHRAIARTDKSLLRIRTSATLAGDDGTADPPFDLWLVGGRCRARLLVTVGPPAELPELHLRVWNPAVAAAGLDGVTAQDLRHIAATCLDAVGAPEQLIRRRLVDGSSDIMRRVYVHVRDDTDKRITRALGELVWRQPSRRVQKTGGQARSAALPYWELSQFFVPLVRGTAEVGHSCVDEDEKFEDVRPFVIAEPWWQCPDRQMDMKLDWERPARLTFAADGLRSDRE